MENIRNDQYTAGYLAGYRDGIRAVMNNQHNNAAQIEIGNLPINVMTISTQAKNCLTRAGCIYVSDAAVLDEHTIKKIRYMGVKTAAEIARWMSTHGYPYTAWTLFL